VYLTHLTLIHFRNYQSLDLSFSSKGAFFSGLNGMGKTNLMEAIHFLSTGRSQRHASRKELIHSASQEAFLSGTFESTLNSLTHTVSYGFSRDNKANFTIDNQKDRPLSEWFNASAIVSFGPDDIFLITGAPADRRRFLDIILSQTDQTYLSSLILYKKFTLERNRLLLSRSDNLDIEVYEERMAHFGSYLITRRNEFVESYCDFFAQMYSEISCERERAGIRYASSIKNIVTDQCGNKQEFEKLLRQRRKNDFSFGFSSVGPHRDELQILLNDRPARGYASQGQSRSMAIALKMVSMKLIEQNKQERLMILVDDAFSELDHTRTESIFPLIQGKGQLFITTLSQTRSAFFDLPSYSIDRGTVENR
jgi:DNA replication and repair protein RecF